MEGPENARQFCENDSCILHRTSDQFAVLHPHFAPLVYLENMDLTVDTRSSDDRQGMKRGVAITNASICVSSASLVKDDHAYQYVFQCYLCRLLVTNVELMVS